MEAKMHDSEVSQGLLQKDTCGVGVEEQTWCKWKDGIRQATGWYAYWQLAVLPVLSL